MTLILSARKQIIQTQAEVLSVHQPRKPPGWELTWLSGTI